MNINSVNQGASVYKTNEQNQVARRREDQAEAPSKSRRQDTLELSSEARQLNQVQQKIDSGFYDDSAVLREVAQRVNKDL